MPRRIRVLRSLPLFLLFAPLASGRFIPGTRLVTQAREVSSWRPPLPRRPTARPALPLAASERGTSFHSPADAPNATPSLLRELNSGAEEIRVIIGVKDGTPSARRLLALPDPGGEPERRIIRVAAQKRLAEEMTSQRLAVRHFYEGFSMLAGTVTRDAAVRLASRPDVAWVDLDRKAHLVQTPQSSLILIRSDQTNAAGFTGSGQAVAVIDTGVDYNVAALGGGGFPNNKVIGGIDIADNDNDPMDCEGHGTEVAAIAAGLVAPDAKIVAIKIFPSQDPANTSCKDTASFSDIFAGIDYAITHKTTFGITAINLSLGGSLDDSLDHGYCDADDPGSAAAIDAATAAGLVVAVAAGNDGLSNQLSVPACVSSAVSVGAVYADSRTQVSWSDGSGGILCTDQPVNPDQVVCFSNSTTILSLLAPGAFWSVVTKGGTQASFSGTSAATPAVSGAVLLLKQARPDLTPAGVAGVLRMTGKPITDSRNGTVTPRIDTLAAVQLDPPSFSISSSPPVDIPDGTGYATTTTTVSGFVRPLTTVQIWVQINHPEPEQLRLTLLGPDGTSVLLRDQTGASEHPINAIYGKTDTTVQSLDVFAGKPANGMWTLKVEDLVAGTTGRIRNFSVRIVPAENLGYFTLAPCRVADTRDPNGPSGGPALAANTVRTFPVSGICGIPSTARAVAINLAVFTPTDDGDLRVYPAGGATPLASSINFRPGIVRANNAVIPLGAGGQISIQCDMPSGGTHFFFDMYGYFE